MARRLVLHQNPIQGTACPPPTIFLAVYVLPCPPRARFNGGSGGTPSFAATPRTLGTLNMTGDEEWREALASPELSAAEATGSLAEGGPLRFTLLVRACFESTSGTVLFGCCSEERSEASRACLPGGRRWRISDREL